MKRRGLSTIFALWLVAAAMLCSVAKAQGNKKEPEAMKLKVGDMAPDFKLEYVDGKEEKEVSLSQYRGKSNVVLAFYVFAFTGG
jgi:cytochrome oxidase Cu insertion factor (SCO1/SenC/PrrC family)